MSRTIYVCNCLGCPCEDYRKCFIDACRCCYTKIPHRREYAK